MNKILSVNAGSSSLKFKLFDMPEELVLMEGIIERIGLEDATFKIKFNDQKINNVLSIKNHEEAVNLLISSITKYNIIGSLDEIKGIGHRVVHGGEIFKNSVILNETNIQDIEKLSDLAPLHNPANVTGIRAFRKFLPQVPLFAVFDTAFHQTMKEEAYIYGIPYEWYKNYGIRKYGFHGTSHKYVSERVAEITGKKDLKVIVCHLGNGGSICAIDHGLSIDTTMGFTPLAGILMGTRAGDIDSAIIPYIANKMNLSLQEIDTYLNKKSGFLGISGISHDSRDIEQGMEEGNDRCKLAHKIFIRKIVSYIGAYHVLLNGADVIAFTAGIGENSSLVRQDIMKNLEVLGIKIDDKRNNIRGIEREISTNDSKIRCFIIPTNEEIMIAREVIQLLTHLQ